MKKQVSSESVVAVAPRLRSLCVSFSLQSLLRESLLLLSRQWPRRHLFLRQAPSQVLLVASFGDGDDASFDGSSFDGSVSFSSFSSASDETSDVVFFLDFDMYLIFYIKQCITEE